MLAISAFAIGFFPVSVMMSGVIVGLFYGIPVETFSMVSDNPNSPL